jgi:hypothetical protein
MVPPFGLKDFEKKKKEKGKKGKRKEERRPFFKQKKSLHAALVKELLWIRFL